MSFTSTFPTNTVKFSAVLAVRTITVSDVAMGTEAVSSRLIGALDSGVGVEAPLVNLTTRDMGVGSEVVSSRLASLIDAATGVDKSLPVSIPELIFRSFSECVESLRYVSYGTPVESRDLNVKTTCIKLMRDTLDKYRYKLYVPASIVDPLIDKLDAVIATIRYVKSGDIIQPEDHNYIVDALKKARDIIAKMEEYYISLLSALASVSPFTGLGVGFGFSTYPDNPVPPSLPYAGTGLLTVDVSYDSDYVSPCTALVVEVPIYRPGYYVGDGVS